MSARSHIERDIAIVACAISAGVHAALTPEHFREGRPMGVGFLVAAALLGALVVLLSRRSGATAPLLSALVLAGVLAAYAAATTGGLPLAHPEPEPIDGLAVATKLVELVGLVAAVDLVRRSRGLALHPPRTKGRTT